MSYFDKHYEKYTVEQLDAFERDVAKRLSVVWEEQAVLDAQRANLNAQHNAVLNARSKKIVQEIEKQNKTGNVKDQADFSALLESFGGR